MKCKISILLLSLLLIGATNSYAKVRYGYVRNTSISGNHMGALERVLAPGVELSTGKVNIQALDYGFQGYMGDIILFLLEHPNIEIITKTLDQDGHWKEGIDLENGILKVIISEVDDSPKTLTEYFVKRIHDTTLSLAGTVGSVTTINDVVFYGFERLFGESVDTAKILLDFTDLATDIFSIQDKAKELIEKKIFKYNKVRKIYDKIFSKKVIMIITNYLSPTKERNATSVINTGHTRINFDALGVLLYATKN
jgi:hypothetical protein